MLFKLSFPSITHVFFVAFFSSLFGFATKAQKAYLETHKNLADSNYYPLTNRLFAEDKADSVILISQAAFDYYNGINNESRALYHFINGLYKLTGYGFRQQSIPYLESFIKKHENDLDTTNVHYATLIQTLAFGYKFEEKLDLSKPLYEKALKIVQSSDYPSKMLGEIHESYGSLILYMGDVYGGYENLQKAREIMESYKDYHAVAHCYLEMARAAGTTEQHELSYQFNQRAIDLIQQYFPHSFNHVVATSNQSNNCMNIGKIEESFYWASYADSVIHHYNLVDNLNMVYFSIIANSGISKKMIGEYQVADGYFKQLAAQIKKYYGNTPFVGDAYTEIARNFKEWGKTDSAIAYYDKTLAVNPEFIDAHLDLAILFNEMLDYKSAYTHALKALNMLTRKDSIKTKDFPYTSNDFQESLSGFRNNFLVAKSLYGMGDNYELCSKHLLLADTLFSSFINATIIGKNDAVIAQMYHDFASLAAENYLHLYKTSKKQSDLEYVFHFISKSKSINLNTQVTQTVLSNKNSGIWQNQIDLLQRIKMLENRLRVADKDKPALTDTQLEEELFQERIKAFETSYKFQKDNEIKDFLRKNILNLKISDVQAVIPKNKTIVSYHIGENSILAMLISKETADIVEIPIDNTFPILLNDYYKAVKTGSNQCNELGRSLYTLLIAPLKDYLSNSSHLVIIPDGKLMQIPFETLISEKNTFLIEHYSIAYNYSIHLWYNNPPKNNELKLLALAPVFSNGNYELASKNPLRYDSLLINDYRDIMNDNMLSPLYFSKVEVENVTELFKSSKYEAKILLNEAANEKNLKALSGDYSIVHLATHGYSSFKEPHLSGLFLATINDSADITNDGFLYTDEIYNMRFKATDLVVLSACKTGVGKIVEGEGVLALPRGFIFAGVPNIIVSLWKIHDERTKNLMIEFYKNVLNHTTYAEALRLAKIQMIKKGELPMDWSGIVLLGN